MDGHAQWKKQFEQSHHASSFWLLIHKMYVFSMIPTVMLFAGAHGFP